MGKALFLQKFISYINRDFMRAYNLDTFKHPLSQDEERHYLLLSKQGDIEARNTLVEYNLRLVAHIVKKYQAAERNTEDLISIGTIGLIKAVNTYDIDKGNRLATYASRCIENELLMRLRQERKEAREISLYEPIGTDKEGNEISLMDIIKNDDENVLIDIIHNDNLSYVSKIFNKVLDKREQEILNMRYGLNGNDELTQKEVAKKLGISRSYVSRIEKKALLKLRGALLL
ncbi:MAG: RNA polymerase sporulation sigma factor SigK [Lachnospiraceae bacterium]|nr:RNA polymerase sporulation sigma factor SigK [Lachnospiraceae bacterium]